ncbi:MAG: electron transfer flavoprotein subunit alpha/FixB family protein, partial [Burkholderiales bacterium]|nr:electron transfer flavoprotein subunit alpha/FixB family protein [Burkholderiales bacterium]
DGSVATGCVELSWRAGRFQFTRPCYGGNVRETLSFARGVAVATVRAGCGEAAMRDEGRRGVVDRFSAMLGDEVQRVRVVERRPETIDGIRLEDAGVIVAGGRGLNGPEGFSRLQELAGVLGAAVGASRVPCDLGWCPRAWQIGLTGRTVQPELYIAIGISGAGHHMAGCGNAKTIVAVNTDPDAAIYKDARFGIVGDYQQFLPAFIEEVRKLKAEHK